MQIYFFHYKALSSWLKSVFATEKILSLDFQARNDIFIILFKTSLNKEENVARNLFSVKDITLIE